MSFRFPATVIAFLSIVWLKAIYPPASGLMDTDFFWHLTYGLWMVEHGAIPTVDFFSWTFSGMPYQITQWLGEAAIGIAYSLNGFAGTKLLSVALTAITIGFAWRAAARYVHTSVALCIALACNWLQIITPMRPQLFSFAMLAISTYLVVSWMETRRLKFLAIYPLAIAAWVNMHGGFVVGLILIFLLAAGLSIEAVAGKKLGDKETQRDLLLLWATGLISVVATFLNPYGYKALATVIMIGGLQSSSVIIEWQPVNLLTGLGWAYLSALIPFVGIIALTGVRPRISHALMATFFLIFGVMANRQVALCGAVMAPLIAAVLAKTPQYKKMLPTFSNPSHPIAYVLIAVALVCSYPTIAAIGDTNLAKNINRQHPVAAADFLETHKLTDRVLSDTLESSYLIHRGIPVFIDGRLDLYQDQFFFEWYLASKATNGWDLLIDRYKPNSMLLRVDVALRQVALASGDWKQVYEDERYSILVPSPSPLPEEPPHRLKYLDGSGHLIRYFIP